MIRLLKAFYYAYQGTKYAQKAYNATKDVEHYLKKGHEYKAKLGALRETKC